MALFAVNQDVLRLDAELACAPEAQRLVVIPRGSGLEP